LEQLIRILLEIFQYAMGKAWFCSQNNLHTSRVKVCARIFVGAPLRLGEEKRGGTGKEEKPQARPRRCAPALAPTASCGPRSPATCRSSPLPSSAESGRGQKRGAEEPGPGTLSLSTDGFGRTTHHVTPSWRSINSWHSGVKMLRAPQYCP